MKFIANLKISVAISLLVAGAFIAIAMLASQIIMSDMKSVKVMTELSQLTKLSTLSSNLLHEMQKERGYSGIFLGSKGEKLKAELEAQRPIVDKQKTALVEFAKGLNRAIYGDSFSDQLDEILSELAKMDAMRSSISSLSIERPLALGY